MEDVGLTEHSRFAQFTSDTIFKKAFAENDRSEHLLAFLLNVFLKEKLKSPIEEVEIISNEILGEAGHNRGAVYLSVRNDNHPEVGYDMLQMVYVILPRFCKTDIECETIMDKIMFSLKHGHELERVPENFTEEELGLLFDLAEISNFTEKELSEYGAAMMNRYDYKASIDYAKKEGKAEGREEGIAIGEAKGMEKGIAKGKAEGAAEVFAFLAQGFSQEEAMRKLGMQKQ